MKSSRFRTAGVLCAMQLIVVGCDVFSGSPPPRNLVLVVVDTLRADRMSIYGHDRETTPSLDAMERELGVYEHVQAVAPWTVPTHASLFTGLLPAEHRAQWGHPVYVDDRPTLAEWLTGHGFTALGLSANNFVSERHGLARGFDRFVNVRGPAPVRTPRLMDRVGAWLDAREVGGDRSEADRLFLFVNLMDTHIPYVTGPHAERFGVVGSGPIDSSRAKWQASAGEPPLSEQARVEHGAAYDAAVRQTDDVIAELFALLDRNGLLEDSLVVITSDHGDGLGEHAQLGHSISVWEEQLRVPLIVSHPGRAGRRIAQRVSQLWLTPSLFDWLGVDRPPHLQGAASLDDGSAPITSDYRNYFSEQRRERNRKMRIRYPGLARATRHMHVVYCDDHKLIVSADGVRRHFDLASDPTEQSPLPPTAPAAAACEARYAELVEAGRFTPFEAVSTEAQRKRADEAYDEESLRELGYLE